MAILHKNITAAADIHNPKWFSGANNGDYAFKNEKGELESIDELEFTRKYENEFLLETPRSLMRGGGAGRDKLS